MVQKINKYLGEQTQNGVRRLIQSFTNAGYHEGKESHFGAKLVIEQHYSYKFMWSGRMYSGVLHAYAYIYPREKKEVTNITINEVVKDTKTGDSLIERLGGFAERLGG